MIRLKKVFVDNFKLSFKVLVDNNICCIQYNPKVCIQYTPKGNEWELVEGTEENKKICIDFLCHNIVFTSNEEIINWCEMCYEEEWYNYSFTFILVRDYKYTTIECCDCEYYVEEFKTLQQACMWLYGIEKKVYKYLEDKLL